MASPKRKFSQKRKFFPKDKKPKGGVFCVGRLPMNQSTLFFSNITTTIVFLFTSSSVCLRFLTLLAGVDPAGKVQSFCWLKSKARSLFYLDIGEIKGNRDRESDKSGVSVSWGNKTQRKPNPRKSFRLWFHSKFFHYDLCKFLMK